MLVIKGGFVHSLGPEKLEILPDHSVVVDDAGRITFFGPSISAPEADPAAKVIELGRYQFVVPGFVDAHVHAPQYPNAGIFSDTLMEWLDKYAFPLESKFADEDFAKKIYSKVVARSIQNGTTTSSYFGTVHVAGTLALARECLSQGQRALVGRVCMERYCPTVLQDGRIESDIDVIEGIRKLDPKGDLVSPVVTPRFAPSCSAETLKSLGTLARERKVPVQTHISESAGEMAFVEELFPEAKNYTDVYDRAGLLKNDTILAHAIHLSQDELEVIKANECGLVHCPYSNAAITSGLAPVRKYITQGLKVGLGTDVSGGASISVLKNLRMALLNSNLLAERYGGAESGNSLSLANGIYLGTLGGATVCNLNEKTGNFVVGKLFDAQLVDVLAPGSSIDLFESTMPEAADAWLDQLLRRWVYIGDERNTISVWVGGRQVHQRSD